MNFQQLKAVRETVRCNFNLKRVADSLFISQPGVGHQIRNFEEELGIRVFERNGKRLIGTTEIGRRILGIVERMLDEEENLRQAGSEFSGEKSGTLTVATTYSQARHMLPKAIQSVRALYPDVRIALQQGSAEQVSRWLIAGKADVGIVTENIADYRELVTLPCDAWHHVVAVPEGHSLLSLQRPITLRDLSVYPLITDDAEFANETNLDAAFAAERLRPNIALTAMDSDVVLRHVVLGLGVGIVAPMALTDPQFRNLRVIDVSHLFAPNVTRLVLKRGSRLRSYVHAFMIEFSPGLSQEQITRTIFDAAFASAPGISI